jgi:hypothetical protein
MTMLFGSQILTGLFLLTAKSQNMRQATFGSGLAVK